MNYLALLLLPLVLLTAVGFGRFIHRTVLRCVGADQSSIEQCLFGAATGLGSLAYIVLGLGLLRMLYPLTIWLAVAAMLAVGLRDLVDLVKLMRAGISNSEPHKISATDRALGIALVLATAYFAMISLIGCMAPPTSLEWDSLSYHLADPKIYLAHHRILYLPWESHSNFAFTMEMLYLVGLSVQSIALAKLFHFTLAVIAAIALYRLGARVASPVVGLIAATIFVSLPLVFWEAGTAYVDLGATGFGALALLAWCAGLQSNEGSRRQWLTTSAVMCGWMVSTKATSLITAGVLCLGVGVLGYREHKHWAKSILQGARFAAVTGIVGCVWYLKSWIYTGNPFYPFAYSIFGGKYWNATNAADYSAAQSGFGAEHRGHSLLLRFKDILDAPWNLTMGLIPGHFTATDHPFNDIAGPLFSLSPLFLAVLVVPLLVKINTNTAIRFLGLYSALMFVAWCLLTQQVRYLMPLLPVLCLLTAVCIWEICQPLSPVSVTLGLLAAASIVFSAQVGFQVAATELPVITGAMSVDDYIQRGFSSYSAMQYLNTSTPPGSGVVFYGEPRGFYCDRNYLWGEPGHSLLIPYASNRSPDALRSYFLSHGIQYVLINVAFAPVKPGRDWAGTVYALTIGGQSPPVFEQGETYVFKLN